MLLLIGNDNDVAGDAIWLQAGEFTVLGAFYSGGPVVAHESRRIHPGLISCRREDAYKAQQYGRWIVLNAENPIESIGKPVLHLDNVIFEQEWYFLASKTPYESRCVAFTPLICRLIAL